MATNYLSAGHNVSVTAPAVKSSGDGVLVGSIFGVAQTDAANGADLEIATMGVYTLPKLSAQAWTLGQLVYWDDTNSRCTTVASGNKLIGAATAVAANPSDDGSVRLNGSFTQ